MEAHRPSPSPRRFHPQVQEALPRAKSSGNDSHPRKIQQSPPPLFSRAAFRFSFSYPPPYNPGHDVDSAVNSSCTPSFFPLAFFSAHPLLARNATAPAEVHELRVRQPRRAEMEDSTGRCGLRGMDIAAELPLGYAVHDRPWRWQS